MYKLAGQKCTINAHYNVHFCQSSNSKALFIINQSITLKEKTHILSFTYFIKVLLLLFRQLYINLINH